MRPNAQISGPSHKAGHDNWQKNVKAADAGASSQPNISPLNAARQNFFLEVLTDLTECRPAIRELCLRLVL